MQRFDPKQINNYTLLQEDGVTPIVLAKDGTPLIKVSDLKLDENQTDILYRGIKGKEGYAETYKNNIKHIDGTAPPSQEELDNRTYYRNRLIELLNTVIASTSKKKEREGDLSVTEAADETITLIELLGPKGKELYDLALIEEQNSEAYREALLLNSTTKIEDNKRDIAIIVGPAGGGKTSAADAVMKEAVALEDAEDKPSPKSTRYVISCDGDIARKTSQVYKAAIRTSNILGYTGVADLYKNTKSISKTKNLPKAIALDKNSRHSASIPKTFAGHGKLPIVGVGAPITLKNKLLDQLTELYEDSIKANKLNKKAQPNKESKPDKDNIKIIFCLVVGKNDENFKNIVAYNGAKRAWKIKWPKHEKFITDLNSTKDLCGSKAYKGKNFNYGITGSQKAFDYAQENFGDAFFGVKVINDLIFVKPDPADPINNWVPTEKDGPGVMVVSEKNLEAWKLLTPPKITLKEYNEDPKNNKPIIIYAADFDLLEAYKTSVKLSKELENRSGKMNEIDNAKLAEYKKASIKLHAYLFDKTIDVFTPEDRKEIEQLLDPNIVTTFEGRSPKKRKSSGREDKLSKSVSKSLSKSGGIKLDTSAVPTNTSSEKNPLPSSDGATSSPDIEPASVKRTKSAGDKSSILGRPRAEGKTKTPDTSSSETKWQSAAANPSSSRAGRHVPPPDPSSAPNIALDELKISLNNLLIEQNPLLTEKVLSETLELLKNSSSLDKLLAAMDNDVIDASDQDKIKNLLDLRNVLSSKKFSVLIKKVNKLNKDLDTHHSTAQDEPVIGQIREALTLFSELDKAKNVLNNTHTSANEYILNKIYRAISVSHAKGTTAEKELVEEYDNLYTAFAEDDNILSFISALNKEEIDNLFNIAQTNTNFETFSKKIFEQNDDLSKLFMIEFTKKWLQDISSSNTAPTIEPTAAPGKMTDEKKRDLIIKEIVNTEKSYIKDLTAFYTIFNNLIIDKQSPLTPPQKEELSQLLKPIKELMENKKIIELSEALDDEKAITLINDIIVDSDLKEIISKFSDVVTNESAMLTYRDASKESYKNTFSRLIYKLELEYPKLFTSLRSDYVTFGGSGHTTGDVIIMDFTSVIIKPMQRFTKYPPAAISMSSLTPQNYEYKPQIEKLKQETLKFAEDINEVQRVSEKSKLTTPLKERTDQLHTDLREKFSNLSKTIMAIPDIKINDIDFIKLNNHLVTSQKYIDTLDFNIRQTDQLDTLIDGIKNTIELIQKQITDYSGNKNDEIKTKLSSQVATLSTFIEDTKNDLTKALKKANKKQEKIDDPIIDFITRATKKKRIESFFYKLINLPMKEPTSIDWMKNATITRVSQAAFKIEILSEDKKNTIPFMIKLYESDKPRMALKDSPHLTKQYGNQLYTVPDQILRALQPYHHIEFTEFVNGKNLYDLKRDTKNSAARLELAKKYLPIIKRMIADINAAGDYFPDLKLSNFMVRADGNLVISDIKNFYYSQERNALTTDILTLSDQYLPNRLMLGDSKGKNLKDIQNYLIGISIYEFVTGYDFLENTLYVNNKIDRNDITTPKHIFDDSHEVFKSEQGQALLNEIQRLTGTTPAPASVAKPTTQAQLDLTDLYNDALDVCNAIMEHDDSLGLAIATLNSKLSLIDISLGFANSPIDKDNQALINVAKEIIAIANDEINPAPDIIDVIAKLKTADPNTVKQPPEKSTYKHTASPEAKDARRLALNQLRLAIKIEKSSGDEKHVYENQYATAYSSQGENDFLLTFVKQLSQQEIDAIYDVGQIQKIKDKPIAEIMPDIHKLYYDTILSKKINGFENAINQQEEYYLNKSGKITDRSKELLQALSQLTAYAKAVQAELTRTPGLQNFTQLQEATSERLLRQYNHTYGNQAANDKIKIFIDGLRTNPKHIDTIANYAEFKTKGNTQKEQIENWFDELSNENIAGLKTAILDQQKYYINPPPAASTPKTLEEKIDEMTTEVKKPETKAKKTYGSDRTGFMNLLRENSNEVIAKFHQQNFTTALRNAFNKEFKVKDSWFDAEFLANNAELIVRIKEITDDSTNGIKNALVASTGGDIFLDNNKSFISFINAANNAMAEKKLQIPTEPINAPRASVRKTMSPKQLLTALSNNEIQTELELELETEKLLNEFQAAMDAEEARDARLNTLVENNTDLLEALAKVAEIDLIDKPTQPANVKNKTADDRTLSAIFDDLNDETLTTDINDVPIGSNSDDKDSDLVARGEEDENDDLDAELNAMSKSPDSSSAPKAGASSSAIVSPYQLSPEIQKYQLIFELNKELWGVLKEKARKGFAGENLEFAEFYFANVNDKGQIDPTIWKSNWSKFFSDDSEFSINIAAKEKFNADKIPAPEDLKQAIVEIIMRFDDIFITPTGNRDRTLAYKDKEVLLKNILDEMDKNGFMNLLTSKEKNGTEILRQFNAILAKVVNESPLDFTKGIGAHATIGVGLFNTRLGLSETFRSLMTDKERAAYAAHKGKAHKKPAAESDEPGKGHANLGGGRKSAEAPSTATSSVVTSATAAIKLTDVTVPVRTIRNRIDNIAAAAERIPTSNPAQTTSAENNIWDIQFGNISVDYNTIITERKNDFVKICKAGIAGSDITDLSVALIAFAKDMKTIKASHPIFNLLDPEAIFSSSLTELDKLLSAPSIDSHAISTLQISLNTKATDLSKRQIKQLEENTASIINLAKAKQTGSTLSTSKKDMLDKLSAPPPPSEVPPPGFAPPPPGDVPPPPEPAARSGAPLSSAGTGGEPAKKPASTPSLFSPSPAGPGAPKPSGGAPGRTSSDPSIVSAMFKGLFVTTVKLDEAADNFSANIKQFTKEIDDRIKSVKFTRDGRAI